MSAAVAPSLAAVLAAEYAASYGYGVVGAQSRGTARSRARVALAWHQAQASSIAADIVAAGGATAAPEPAYVLPFTVDTGALAARLAVQIEERVAAAYSALVADSIGARRVAAAQSLAACAVRSATWSGRSEPFPGIPERAGP